jgi:hypothetical protein
MYETEDMWDFLPSDDEVVEFVSLSPEESALHVAEPSEWLRPIEDPGRQDVVTADADAIAPIVADDEDDGVIHRASDREPDLEELLEQQHYAFPASRRDAA